METKILLDRAREDHSDALNILFMVLECLPVTIEDMMYGYMVACDWC